MQFRSSLAVAVLLLASLFCSPSQLRAAEMVDNPQYVSWSKHKPGSKVSMKQDIAMGPMNISSTATQTLIEVTADKAVIEYATTVDVGGQKQESKNKQEVTAKVEKGKEFAPPGGGGTAKEVGTEKVEIAGKSYDCKVIEMTNEGQQGKGSGKMWHTTEIPGGMAKLEVKMEQPQPGTIKMIVTGIDVK